VLGCHMLARRIEADNGIGVGGRTGSHLDESSGTCLNGAERVSRQGDMVQCGVALSILLVVDNYSYRVGSEEIFEG
jgi:hypothetical protein